LVEFPVFTYTHSIEHSTHSITAEVMVEDDKQWSDREIEKAVAEIAEPRLYQLSGGFGCGSGVVKNHLRADQPSFTSTSDKYPGVFVGEVYETPRRGAR